MLVRANKYANAEEVYNAHLVLAKAKVEEKVESSRKITPKKEGS